MTQTAATHFLFLKISALLLSVLLAFPSTATSVALPYTLSDGDRSFLEQLQKDSFEYFLYQTDPETGLTKDASRPGAPASIAATGFALASFGIATTHGWLSYREAYEKIKRTLTTLERGSTHRKGFFYHFLDPVTARRAWASEVSSIDTALLIAGALLAASYFPGTEVETRARKLYERIDWNWMLNGSYLFNHGWRPKQGFLPYYWDMYSEHLILQALALGTETRSIPDQVWTEWKRTKESYNNKEIVHSYSGSLFTYQFPHAFIDFRNLNDRGVNYFKNSRDASFANQEYSVENADEFETYRDTVWGLSASLGPDGYRAYGAPPGEAYHDGTIAIHAAIGSIVFTPDASIAAIRTIYEHHSERLYGRYGFVGSYNLDRDWQAREHLGIDQGLIVLMLENYLRNGAVWKRFMKLTAIKRWIERIELRSETA